MFSSLRYIHLLLLIGCGCLLTQCTTLKETHLRVSEPLASPYTMPADAYLALAKNQTGEEKNALLIMAAGRLIYEGRWQQGESILTQLSALSSEDFNEKQILLAKIDLLREHPTTSIAKLSAIGNTRSLSLYYQAQFHDILAQAYQLTNRPSESVSERIKLERILPDEASRANNRRALWLSLTKFPLEEIHTQALEAPEGSILQGYMQLTLIARLQTDDPEAMLHALERWQQTHPNHPGNDLLPSPLSAMRDQLYAKPQHIALLLPLTGALKGPGLAFKDGFMTAYDTSNAPRTTQVRFYNTTDADVTALYQQALEEGADYIVGPLTKPDVARVANLSHPVPTLLLNDADQLKTDNAFLFGLSPAHEARQVAAKARKNGLTRVLIITPEGPWGNEIAHAFSDQWRMSGGIIVDSYAYSADTDLNHGIRDFLHVSPSALINKKPKALQGYSPDTSPKRRQDFDVIFLVAYPSKARQIKPLINYYFAQDIPVYATSSVYGGSPNAQKDRDLNGIIFCDMPWIFSHHIKSENWPEQFNSYDRLYALGMDSFEMGTQLNQLRLFPAMGINDKSGIVYLTPQHHISRMLAFGQFKQGLATPIDGE